MINESKKKKALNKCLIRIRKNNKGLTFRKCDTVLVATHDLGDPMLTQLLDQSVYSGDVRNAKV